MTESKKLFTFRFSLFTHYLRCTMLKKVAFIILVCIASLTGKSQSSLYPWNTGVLSFGLGITNVSIDSGIWTWKFKNPGIQLDSVQKIQFSHMSIPVRMEILDKHFYVNSHANFMLPFAISGSPKGFSGHLNQSFSFRIGGGVCLAKRISLIPTVQFETSNLYINGKGIPSYDLLNANKGTRYYAYVGTLYSGFGFTAYGSITNDIGFRIGSQKNNIQFAANYGNTERSNEGPRKI